MPYIRPYFNFSIFQFLFSWVFPLLRIVRGDIPKNAWYREKAENSGKIEIWPILGHISIFQFSNFYFLGFSHFSRLARGDIPKNARYREKAENSGKVEIWAIFQLSNFPIGFFPLYTGRRVRLFRRNGRYTKNWEIVGKVEIWEVFPKFQLSDYIPTFQLPRCVSCII